MKDYPSFCVEDGWDNSSILIKWDDNLPYEALEFIDLQLSNVQEKSVYHTDFIINNVLDFLINHKYLMKSPITKTWIMRRGIDNDYYTCKWDRM